MAIVWPHTKGILRAFANIGGSITIEQLGERGIEGHVSVDPADVFELADLLKHVLTEMGPEEESDA